VAVFVTDSPRVSVIVPFLDVSAFLAEAIESVRAQTFTEWELLLCDDASTDGSSDIARRYAALDPGRIIHLTHDGGGTRGASETRNLGARRARGEIIAFLDGDDVWLPEKLQQQLAILDAHPRADAMYGLTELWYSWSGLPGDAAKDRTVPMGVESHTLLAPRQLITGALRRELQMPCMCSMLVRAAAVRRTGGFVEQFTGMYDDQVFYAKLSLDSNILFVEQCWDRYRRHPGSMYANAQGTEIGTAARLQFLTWLERYSISVPGGSDPSLQSALRAALRRVRHPRVFGLIDGLRATVRRLAGGRR
jgi:glycosyltransferase involved in cell wall biosynthesis